MAGGGWGLDVVMAMPFKKLLVVGNWRGPVMALSITSYQLPIASMICFYEQNLGNPGKFRFNLALDSRLWGR
jgi:hypothetical protein